MLCEGELSGEHSALFAPLMPHLAKLDGDAFFGFVADRTIAALIELAKGST